MDFRFFVELFIKQEVPEIFQLFLVHGRYTTKGKQASIFPLRDFFSSKQREKLPQYTHRELLCYTEGNFAEGGVTVPVQQGEG